MGRKIKIKKIYKYYISLVLFFWELKGVLKCFHLFIEVQAEVELGSCTVSKGTSENKLAFACACVLCVRYKVWT